jgi:hypothetical protein
MNFREVAAPSPLTIMDPDQEFGLLIARRIQLGMPPAKLFADEAEHWHAYLEADETFTSPAIRQTAESISLGLKAIWIGRNTLARADVSIQEVLPWYKQAIATMAFSRFSREVFGGLDNDTTTDLTDGLDVCIDYNPLAGSRHCWHIKNDSFQRLGFDTSGPGQTGWYEGASVYVQTTSPASPSDAMARLLQSHPGRPFDGRSFMSARPYFKRAAWYKAS